MPTPLVKKACGHTVRLHRRENADQKYCLKCRQEQHAVIERDPAVQRYFTVIKSRPRNDGYLSYNTRAKTLRSVRLFLQFLNVPTTEHGLSDLITHKRNNPQDLSLDDKLEEFANKQPIKDHRSTGTYILGIFKGNRAESKAKSDCNFRSETEPISDGILKAIYNDMDEDSKLLMDYQSFAGERIGCLARAGIQRFKRFDSKYTTLFIERTANKNRIQHHSIIPDSIAQRVLERAKSNPKGIPFPDYARMWKKITIYAREKYDVKLNSSYLRKRFETIAEETAMPTNHWC